MVNCQLLDKSFGFVGYDYSRKRGRRVRIYRPGIMFDREGLESRKGSVVQVSDNGAQRRAAFPLE